MFDFRSTADDVLAVTVSGQISGADLDAIMTLLDEKMGRHEKLHVFVETKGIDGIEVSGLPAYVPRAIPLFGKLSRSGRVAGVADQWWIRAGTRIEECAAAFDSVSNIRADVT